MVHDGQWRLNLFPFLRHQVVRDLLRHRVVGFDPARLTLMPPDRTVLFGLVCFPRGPVSLWVWGSLDEMAVLALMCGWCGLFLLLRGHFLELPKLLTQVEEVLVVVILIPPRVGPGGGPCLFCSGQCFGLPGSIGTLLGFGSLPGELVGFGFSGCGS